MIKKQKKFIKFRIFKRCGFDFSSCKFNLQDNQPDLEAGEATDDDYEDFIESEYHVNSNDLLNGTIAYVISSTLED
jgi:hypothetical protein